MQSLEEKVDIMLQNQDEIQRCIRNIQNNEINILTVQRDLLKTQFEMQQDIRRLDKKIDDNYQKLDKKIDDNYAKLDKKIDSNAKDTSEILQNICKRLDLKVLPKTVAIL